MLGKKKLSLNLAGGGSHGNIQCGYIKACVDYGLEPEIVMGCSVGALNGSLYVQGDIDKLEELWLTITNDKVYKFHPWTVPLLLLNRNNLLDSTPLKLLIEKYVDFDKLKAAKKEFYITVTNASDWKTEVYSPKDLLEEEFKTLLLASASVPGAFPPVEFRGKMYVDGGLANNWGLSLSVSLGADHIILLAPTPKGVSKFNNVIGMLGVLTSVPEYCYLARELNAIDLINSVQAPFPNLREITYSIIDNEMSHSSGLLDFDIKGVDRKALIKSSYDHAMSILKEMK
jgi:predicted acylesterase/phospholipase RssA